MFSSSISHNHSDSTKVVNYYRVLSPPDATDADIQNLMTATDEEIALVYAKAQSLAKTEEQRKLVSEAYETLSDSVKRDQYHLALAIAESEAAANDEAKSSTPEQSFSKENNYYTILQVPENATTKQIKDQYRSLSKREHSDAQVPFALVTEAYKTLADTDLRKKYDSFLHQLESTSIEQQALAADRLEKQREDLEELYRHKHEEAKLLGKSYHVPSLFDLRPSNSSTPAQSDEWKRLQKEAKSVYVSLEQALSKAENSITTRTQEIFSKNQDLLCERMLAKQQQAKIKGHETKDIPSLFSDFSELLQLFVSAELIEKITDERAKNLIELYEVSKLKIHLSTVISSLPPEEVQQYVENLFQEKNLEKRRKKCQEKSSVTQAQADTKQTPPKLTLSASFYSYQMSDSTEFSQQFMSDPKAKSAELAEEAYLKLLAETSATPTEKTEKILSIFREHQQQLIERGLKDSFISANFVKILLSISAQDLLNKTTEKHWQTMISSIDLRVAKEQLDILETTPALAKQYLIDLLAKSAAISSSSDCKTVALATVSQHSSPLLRALAAQGNLTESNMQISLKLSEINSHLTAMVLAPGEQWNGYTLKPFESERMLAAFTHNPLLIQPVKDVQEQLKNTQIVPLFKSATKLRDSIYANLTAITSVLDLIALRQSLSRLFKDKLVESGIDLHFINLIFSYPTYPQKIPHGIEKITDGLIFLKKAAVGDPEVMRYLEYVRNLMVKELEKRHMVTDFLQKIIKHTSKKETPIIDAIKSAYKEAMTATSFQMPTTLSGDPSSSALILTQTTYQPHQWSNHDPSFNIPIVPRIVGTFSSIPPTESTESPVVAKNITGSGQVKHKASADLPSQPDTRRHKQW